MASVVMKQTAFRANRCWSLAGSVIVIAMVLTAGLCIWNLRDDAITRSQQEIQRLGVVLAEQTSRAMVAADLVLAETRDRIVSAKIVTPAQFTHDLAGEDIHLLLKDRLRNLPQSEAVILIDATGRVVNSSRGWPVPDVHVEDRDYFQHVRGHADSGTFVSESVRSRATGRLIVYLVRRVDGLQGEFLGMVASGIEVSYFEDLYRAITLQEGGSVTMLRRDGTVLARYPDTGATRGGKVAATSRWHDHVAVGGILRELDELDGHVDIASVHPLRDYPVVIDTAIAENAALAQWRRQSTFIVLAVVVAALGLLVTFRALARQFGRLERQADELGRTAEALTASEAKLRRTQEHLEGAQKFAEIGSFERDLHTGDAIWSDNHYHIFGVDKETFETTQENVLALIHPDDVERFHAFNRALLTGNPASMLEYRIIRPDGGCRRVVRETEPIRDESGAVIGLRGTVRDVTQAREVEERRRALELHMQHTQRIEALGTLAGGIAHDLNNTLVPVLALSKSTMRKLPEGSPEYSRMQIIYEAGVRARELVKQILAFSRKETPNKQILAMGDLVRDTLPMLRAAVPTTIAIDHAVEPGLPAILADPSQLHQVVVNLVTNAAQAIGEASGRITVTLCAVAGPPRAEDGGVQGSVCLSIADTGCGMDQATVAHIFEPFFTTKPVGEGTGLGLAVVHGIVANHGGRIEVSSTVQKGTRFDVILPAAEPDATRAHALAGAVA